MPKIKDYGKSKTITGGSSMMMGDYHGDEDEIEAEQRANREAYEAEHADDWKDEPETWGAW